MNYSLYNKDIVLIISEYLTDKDSFRLFCTCKYLNNVLNNNKLRYTIKQTVYNNQPELYDYHLKKWYCIDELGEYSNIPKSVDTIIYNWDCCHDNEITQWPKNVRYLNLGTYDLPLNILPEKLEILKFLQDMTYPLTKLPLSLKYLRMCSYYYKHDIDIRYLINLEKVLLLGKMNVNIDKLPDSVLHISLGNYYNKPITKLPSSLTHLSIGNKFNHSLLNLPKLKTLHLGRNFNKHLTNLPETLETLTINQREYTYTGFNSEIIFPDNLKLFKLSTYIYNKNLVLNNKLETLCIKCEHFNMKLDLPETLKILDMSKCNNYNQKLQLPSKLEVLKMNNSYSEKFDYLPNILRILILGSGYNHKFKSFPDSLETLKLFGYTHKIKKFPSQLKVLMLYNNYNHNIKGLPLTLTTLVLGYDYDNNIDYLPESLIYLCVGKYNKINKYPTQYMKYLIINHDKYINLNRFPQLKCFDIPYYNSHYDKIINNINDNIRICKTNSISVLRYISSLA